MKFQEATTERKIWSVSDRDNDSSKHEQRTGTVYNWMVSFFSDHAHRTVYNGEVSSTKSISASIVQVSSIGPASYAVTDADLRPLHADNSLVKYADDTYLVIPATH